MTSPPVEAPEAIETQPPEPEAAVSLPDTTSASDAPVTETAGTPDSTESARARDEKGRFVPRGAESSETAEPDPATPPVEGAEPAPEAPALPTMPEGTPWTFKAAGQQFTLGEARFVPGVGVVVPEGSIDTLHRTLGQAIKYQQDRAVFEQERQTFRDSIAADREFVQTAGQFYERLAQLALAGEEGLTQAVTELIEFGQKLPTLRAEAKASVLERQLQQHAKASEPSPEQARAQAMSDADEALGELVMSVKAQTKGLTDADWREVANDLVVVMPTLVVQADRDYPDDDVKRGDWVLNEQVAHQLLDRAVKRQQALAAQRTQAEARDKAAKVTQSRTQSQIAAPPVAAGTPAAVPSASGPPQIKTADDLFRFIHS